jgi:hypothetical protein
MEAQKLVGATLSKEKKLKQLPILLNELIDLKNQMSLMYYLILKYQRYQLFH